VTGRRPALVALLCLLAALVAVLTVATPWSVLAGAPEVPTDPALDFTSSERARSASLAGDLRPWTYAALGLGLAGGAVLGLTALGGRLVRAVARPFGGGWVPAAALGGVAVAVVLRLVRLPASARAESVLREYGLSTRTWGDYALDVLRSTAVTAVVLIVVAVLGYAAVRRFARSWWLPVGAGAAALVVVGSFVYPLAVEPVFNRFTPLEQGELRTELLALAERQGVAADDVLVADASRRTTALNAYVSGFGTTRRIVVYDTLLATASPAEVRAVVAHEIGHAARDDVLVGTLQGALGAAAAACAAFLVLGPATAGGAPRLVRRTGAASIGDPRSVALVLFLVSATSLAVSPATLAVSRAVEARADLAALDATQDPESVVDLHRRLAVSNLSDLEPGPLRYAFFLSHPPAPERIAAARRWALREGREPPAPRVAPRGEGDEAAG
jgi:STE24 endopeptidase